MRASGAQDDGERFALGCRIRGNAILLDRVEPLALIRVYPSLPRVYLDAVRHSFDPPSATVIERIVQIREGLATDSALVDEQCWELYEFAHGQQDHSRSVNPAFACNECIRLGCSLSV